MSARRPQVVNIRPTIQKRKTANGTSHVVRWTVDGADRSRSLPNDAQAKRYQRRLHNAVDAGERFDPVTGEPGSWTAGVTALEFAAGWYARHWTSWKDRTREGHREQLPHVLVALTDKPCRPEHRAALVEWIRATVCVKPGTDVSKVPEPRAAARWLRSHSLPMVDIDTKIVDAVLDAFAVKLDASPASINYSNKRRATLSKFLQTAVADRILPASPLAATTRKRRTATMAVDDGALFSVREGHAFLCVLSTISPQARRLVAPLATMLYAGLRPGEVNGVRLADLKLPEEGWGMAQLRHTVVPVKKAATDDGTGRGEGGLKWRASDKDGGPLMATSSLMVLLTRTASESDSPRWACRDRHIGCTCRGAERQGGSPNSAVIGTSRGSDVHSPAGAAPGATARRLR